MDSEPSRARLPPLPSVLQGLSSCCCPTLLLPGHLGCYALCCVRSVQHTARTAAHPLPPLKGCFVFLACKGRKLFLQLNNTVWSLQSSNESQKPPAHECHTLLPRMPAGRSWTNKAHRDTGPLLATLHHHRLLWKLLVPHRLWKWTYGFL